MSAVKSFEPRISDEPTPYASTGTPFSSNSHDLVDREPAGHDDLHVLEAVVVERVAHLAHEPLVDAGRLEVAELLPERAVDERSPTCRAERPTAGRRARRATSSAVSHRVVLEVDEHRDVHVVGRPLGELRRGEHGVAAVGRDQRVRHGADAAAAPPGRLLVGRDADRRADDSGRRRTPRSRRPSGRDDGRAAPA